MAEFLTTTGTSFYIEQLIRTAKNDLVLVTPFLKLTVNLFERVSDADKKGIRITLIYGKNELAISVRPVLRQFWGIILTGTIRPSDEAVQSLPSRTFVV